MRRAVEPGGRGDWSLQGAREAWPGSSVNDEQKPAGEGEGEVGSWAQGQQACLAGLRGIRWHFFSAIFFLFRTFTYIIPLNFLGRPLGRHHCLHYTDEETEALGG